MTDKLTITLRLGTSTHQYPIPREYEESYRKAANIINEKIGQYMERYPDKTNEEYMAVTMLDIAVRLVQKNKEGDAEDIIKSISKLTEEIDEVMN